MARQKAESLAIPRAYGDWRDLIRDPEVQVVHNCTPNNLHCAIGKATIEAGKPIVAEKPLAMNSTESAELLRLINDANLPNEVCFTYRMYPVIQEMHAMVEDNQVGIPWIVWGGYIQDWLWAEADYNWRIDPTISGPSRAMADIGSHWCELAHGENN